MEHDPEIWNSLGVAYSSKENFEKAAVAYEKAISIDHEYPLVYSNLGTLYLSIFIKTKDLKTYEKSLQNFKKAIELDSDCAVAYNGLGDAYRRAGNLDGAIYSWEKALEIRPDFGQTLYNLGLVYLYKGDKIKALDYFNKYKEDYYHLLPLTRRKKLEDLIQKCKQNL